MQNKIFTTVALIIFSFSSIVAQDFDDKLNDAKISMMDGNYESGLAICKELIATGNEDPTKLAEAYASAGMASERLKNIDEALAYYTKAVEFRVPQLDIYDKLISMSKKQDNDSIYEFALLKKLEEFPDFEESITKSLAVNYVNTKQYDKLLLSADKLLGWFPDETKYMYYKAASLQSLDRIDEAKEYYEKILVADPEHAGANMSLGLMLFNSGTQIFEQKKNQYESIAKPTRVDYAVYERGIEKGKAIYRQALPYLLKAYESGSYPSLKNVIFKTYILLEEKSKAEPYR